MFFLIANIFLSYFEASLLAKSWVFVIGIIFPIVLSFYLPATNKPKRISLQPIEEILSGSNPTIIGILIILAIGLRLTRVYQINLWPTGDESLHGFLALSLLQKWSGQFFYTIGEHPPLLIWLLFLSFKIFKSPFVALWIWPFLFSALTLLVGFFCARIYLSRLCSILYVLLLGFSYWPIYFGYFAHQAIFIPFWELTALLIFSFWIRESKNNKGNIWAVFFGIWCGLGTFTFTSWLVVLLGFFIAVLTLFYKKKAKEILYFVISISLAGLPFIYAIYKEGYGHHLLDSSNVGELFSRNHQVVTHLSYITCLFWGSLQANASYGPTWGGILNPLLASAFFIGFVELIKNIRTPFSRWTLFAFSICLLPALLAGDYVELNRILQILPILLLVVVLGLEKLILEGSESKLNINLILVILFLSTILDFNHLNGAVIKSYFQIGNKPALNSDLSIYEILDNEQKTKGPGLIFTDFLPLKYGHSLKVATYPFNGAANPNIDPSSVRWAGIITNVYYQPFLSKRFPCSSWYWPGGDLTSMKGGLMVGIVDVKHDNLQEFDHWVKAHSLFSQFNLEAEKSFNNERDYQNSLRHLASSLPAFEGDRFLEACYWEWSSQYFYDPLQEGNVAALKKAVERGYPAVHLYQMISDCLIVEKRFTEAQYMSTKAIKEKPKFYIQDDPTLGNILENDGKIDRGLLSTVSP